MVIEVLVSFVMQVHQDYETSGNDQSAFQKKQLRRKTHLFFWSLAWLIIFDHRQYMNKWCISWPSVNCRRRAVLMKFIVIFYRFIPVFETQRVQETPKVHSSITCQCIVWRVVCLRGHMIVRSGSIHAGREELGSIIAAVGDISQLGPIWNVTIYVKLCFSDRSSMMSQ